MGNHSPFGARRHERLAMPRGSRGEKRAADVIGNALHVMRRADDTKIEPQQIDAVILVPSRREDARRSAIASMV